MTAGRAIELIARRNIMRNALRRLSGINPLAWFNHRRKLARFKQDFMRFSVSLGATTAPMPMRWDERLACLDDATGTVGFDRHYIYHTAWAARYLAAARPARHVDIGSSLYFVGIASAFTPLEHYDYRAPVLTLDNLAVGSADLKALHFSTESISSLSCMHVIEHVGLGRYGDTMDPDGDKRAMAELARVLAPGGTLLIVVPVGQRRIVFNAHRVYAYDDIAKGFPGCTIESFALVPDDEREGLIPDASAAQTDHQLYGCGCFVFRKLQRAS